MIGRMSVGPMECLVFAVMAAVVLAVLLLLAFLVSRAGRSGRDVLTGTPDTPLDVLRRRLAAGEITPEQFDELRRRIEQ